MDVMLGQLTVKNRVITAIRQYKNCSGTRGHSGSMLPNTNLMYIIYTL